MRSYGATSIAVALVPVLATAAAAQPVSRRALTPRQVWQRLRAGQVLVVDVRTPLEFGLRHVAGAINVPHDAEGERFDELIRLADGRDIVLYCRSGRRARIVAAELARRGFRGVWIMEGQLRGWVAAGLPLAEGDPPPN